jgi:hypothetical protein
VAAGRTDAQNGIEDGNAGKSDDHDEHSLQVLTGPDGTILQLPVAPQLVELNAAQ